MADTANFPGGAGLGPVPGAGLAAPRRAAAERPAMPGFGAAGWTGAIASLALTGGMAVWAAQLALRDVSEVPVIRALEGPMRVAPADPGGRQAAYQGLALGDITSGRGAALAPDAVALAPEPVTLDADALAPWAATDAVEAKAAVVTRGKAALGAEVSRVTDVAARPDAAARPAAAIGAPAPLAPAPRAASASDRVLADPAAKALAEAHAPAMLPAASAPTLRASSRPAPRPRSPLAAPPVTGTRVASAAGVRDVDPGSVAVGTRVAQLGAFDSASIAEREWERLAARHPEYLSGKARMIQKARSGGRDFWRLRAVGFADGDEARRFCSAMTARNAPCIPVTVQ